jgi:hypothetical protein
LRQAKRICDVSSSSRYVLNLRGHKESVWIEKRSAGIPERTFACGGNCQGGAHVASLEMHSARKKALRPLSDKNSESLGAAESRAPSAKMQCASHEKDQPTFSQCRRCRTHLGKRINESERVHIYTHAERERRRESECSARG